MKKNKKLPFERLINNMITYFMPNYFRKYFLVFALLSLSPQPAQAIEIPWILNSLCAVVKSYLPTFSLFSSFAKYNFHKKNIQEQKSLSSTAIKFAASFLVYEYIKKLNITLLKTIQKAQKYNFNLDYHLKKIEECIKQGANPIDLQNLFAKHPEYKKKYEDYKKKNAFLDIIKIAQKHNFDREEDLNEIKKHLKDYYLEIVLKIFFEKHSEYAKKYKQYELNNAFSKAVARCRAYNFAYDDDLKQVQKYIQQGANPEYAGFNNLLIEYPEYAKKWKQYEFLNAVKTAQQNNFNCQEGINKIKECIDQEINPDYPVGPLNETLLMLVSTNENKDLFDFLLTKKININARDENQNNVLHKLAFLYRRLYIYNDRSYNPDLSTSKIYILENLLKHGADVNATNTDLQTPLLAAIDSHYLIENFTTITCYGCYPYFIKSLITSTNVNQPDWDGTTSLRHAIHHAKHFTKYLCDDNSNNFKILESLYKTGASLINLDKDNNSIFHLLVGSKRKHLEQYIKAILTYTQDPYKNQDQQSGERIRDSRRGLDIFKIPLEVQSLIFSFLPDFSGTDVNTIKLLIKNKPQNIPILYRTMNQMVRMQNILQHQNSYGQTPLQILESKNQKKEGVKDLFDENRPPNDFKEFLKVFPNSASENNWAGITYRYLLQNHLPLAQ